MAEEPLEDVKQGAHPTDSSSDATSDPLATDPTAELVQLRAEHENLQKALNKERSERKLANERAKLTAANKALEPDENGMVDANQIVQATLSQARAEMAQREDWNNAVTQFPQLKNSPKLARAVKGAFNQALMEGEYISYEEAAKDILGEVNDIAKKARETGRTEAQVSEEIQSRSGVMPPTSSSKSGSSSIADRYKNGELSKEEIKANWSKIVQGSSS